MKLDVEKLKIFQAQSCLENKALAEKSGISITSLQRIKNGSTNPRLITIGKLARALNVEVTKLIVLVPCEI